MKLWICVGLSLFFSPSFTLAVSIEEAPQYEAPQTPSRVETTVGEDGYITECEWFTQKKPYALCITTKIGSRNRDILYYMHGARGSEKRWIKRFADIREEWDKNGVEPPATVTMSFGPIWLLAEKNKFISSGLVEFISEIVMPTIEERLGGLKGQRILMGESMGGFNTAQLIMKRREMFARAAILCPAITDYGPYTPFKELTEFAKKTKSKRALVYWSVVMQRVFFPDMETWSKASPLKFGQEALDSGTPPLLVSCGRQDEWGFFDGAEKFAELARQRGVNVIWEPVDGDHCSYHPGLVAKFLVQ